VRPRDTASFRCAASYRVRVLLYRSLAHEIAVAPTPAGAVFESVGSDPVPWVTVRPASIAAVALGTAPGAYDPAELTATRPAPRPSSAALDLQGTIVPEPAAAPADDRSGSVDPVALDRRVGPQDWLAVQTFWIRGDHGGVWAARRFRYATADASGGATRFADIARAVARAWTADGSATTVVVRSGFGARRSWRRRTVADVPDRAWDRRPPALLAGSAEVAGIRSSSRAAPGDGHAVVFGSSGAGKTTYLARRAAEAIRGGVATVVLDLHGDLAPAVVDRLSATERERVYGIDASERPVPGISALARGRDEDRIAAVLVAAVKRLSADGTDVYWGFRLERIYDTFVRLVLESGGTLVDLYDLLTSEDRRDAARATTRRPELARFLDELKPVVRRNPDFLWSAATRLSKVVLVPALSELLAPPEGGLPVEELLAHGAALLVRLPIGRLGPEAATLAGTLVLARIFLGVAGATSWNEAPSEVRLVLDEVQGFSPRLVAEVLAESRKYGLRALLATQYPERLAPELRGAAAGASTQFVAFRIPPPAAAEAGAWLGLDRARAETVLPELPPGHGIELDPETGRISAVQPEPRATPGAGGRWPEVLARTRRDLGMPDEPPRSPGAPAVERLLLAVLAAEENGAPLSEANVVAAAASLPGPVPDPAALTDAWPTLARRQWVALDGTTVHLTEGGARWLGLTAPTDAPRETAEHRRLLLRTFRVFARLGYRIEIVRQGRFDTTLPDARFRQLLGAVDRSVPSDLAREIDRARSGWAWRYFGGKDVHVEAEVSGALRAERIRHGCAKANRQGAVALFVVGEASHARRVRASLARASVGRDRAIVWTLAPEHVVCGSTGPRTG
jgi:hypothetical protein